MINRLHLLLLGLGTIAVVAVLHFFALTFYLYWMFWWFDMILHFLGGAVVGFSALVVASFIPTSSRNFSFFIVLSGAVIVGVGWELFELLTGLYPQENYAFDTSIDLIMDVVGAIAAYLLVMHTRLGLGIANTDHGEI